MHALALALLLLAAPAGAATIVIDFAEESLGEHGGSFVSVECACVRFSEWSVGGNTGGGTLTVFDFNGSHALAVGEQGGDLLLEFLVPVGSVRLEFGGDSSSSSVESFPAVLVGLSGGEFASIDTVAPNRNRAIDQTLQVAVPPNVGPPMDQALFHFMQLGENMPLSPFVGRITLTTVPEPSTLALIALGLAGVATRRRRQQLAWVALGATEQNAKVEVHAATVYERGVDTPAAC